MNMMEFVAVVVLGAILTPFLAICFPAHFVALLVAYFALVALIHWRKKIAGLCRRTWKRISRLPTFDRTKIRSTAIAVITLILLLLVLVLADKEGARVQDVGISLLFVASVGAIAFYNSLVGDGLREPPEEKFELVATCITNDPTMAVCGVCGDGTGEDAVFCSDCGAPHHEECWAWNKGCSIYGCGEQRSTPEPKKLQ